MLGRARTWLLAWFCPFNVSWTQGSLARGSPNTPPLLGSAFGFPPAPGLHNCYINMSKVLLITQPLLNTWTQLQQAALYFGILLSCQWFQLSLSSCLGYVMAHMGTRPGNTRWLFGTSSLVEMFGQYRSGPVNRCVCAGSCHIVKYCLFPRAEIIFRDMVLRCLFSETASAELRFPQAAAAVLSGVLLGLGWLQAVWISSFITWDPFLGFVPTSSCSFLTFMLHLHHLLLQPLLPLFFCSPFLHRFFSLFPSAIVPFFDSLLPAFLASVWCLLLFCFLFGAFCLSFSALGWSICAFPASVIWLHGSS